MQTRDGDTMNVILPFLLALFPFLHDTKYPIQITSCEQESVIASYETTPFTLSLFNLYIKDDAGWERTCSLLQEAKKVELEIDSSASVSEPLSAYVFIDGTLLQEQLIREGHALTRIHNPEYTYQAKLSELEKSEQVIAPAMDNAPKKSYPSTGMRFLFCLFLTWLCMAILLWIKGKKILLFSTRQTP